MNINEYRSEIYKELQKIDPEGLIHNGGPLDIYSNEAKILATWRRHLHNRDHILIFWKERFTNHSSITTVEINKIVEMLNVAWEKLGK